MESSAPAFAQRFMRAFWQLKQLMKNRVSPPLKAEHSLELPELLLLRHIAESGRSPTDLADELGIPAPAISRKLDSLESAGLIVRVLDRHDARRRLLSLTASGSELVRSAGETLEREFDRILAVLSREELERFIGTLEKITTARQEKE